MAAAAEVGGNRLKAVKRPFGRCDAEPSRVERTTAGGGARMTVRSAAPFTFGSTTEVVVTVACPAAFPTRSTVESVLDTMDATPASLRDHVKRSDSKRRLHGSGILTVNLPGPPTAIVLDAGVTRISSGTGQGVTTLSRPQATTPNASPATTILAAVILLRALMGHRAGAGA